MLQTVHERTHTSKASSLYCVWICDGPRTRPQAVWIDREMTEFTGQFVVEEEAEVSIKSPPPEGTGELSQNLAAEQFTERRGANDRTD